MAIVLVRALTRKDTRASIAEEYLLEDLVNNVKEVRNAIHNAHIGHWSEQLAKSIFEHVNSLR